MVTKNMHIVTTIYCRYCIFLLYRYNVYLLQTEIIIVHLFIGTSPTIYYILTDRVAPVYLAVLGLTMIPVTCITTT